MSNKSVLSTKREEVLTGEQMLENAIKRRQMQRENMRVLTEARKLNENVEDFTTTMESANINAEREAEKSIALENAYYAQGAKNIVKEQLHMKSRLIREGMEQVYNNILGQIIYESYWLDEPVKESTVNQIEDSVGQILVYIEDKCPGCKVPVEKQNKLLKNIHSLIESVVKEAADRIIKEAEETNSAFSEFELNDEEEAKLDNELRDLGKDEVVELIRDKVAQVIQDERERGKERSETFKEIDDELKANEEDEADLADGGVHTTDGEEIPEDEIDEETTESAKISLKEAIAFDKTDYRYSANERYISSILENGAPFNAFEDPSWNEFKSCISLLCKKAKNILMVGSADCYCAAIPIINDLMNRLSNVPEDVPGDVKEFVVAMVSTIYGTVPADEVIISRMGRMMGSPDLASFNNTVNFTTISWTDILVNIKTNLSSIREYCEAHCVHNNETIANTIPVASTTLESLIARKQNQIMNRNIGSTLFESIMIGNLTETDKVAMESAQNFSTDEIEDAALIESLLHYTVFETLDTLGVYKFRMNDIKGIKKDYIQGVTEGKSPIYGDSDSQTMSNGKDKKGKKKIRINTRKLKVGKDKVKEM